MLILVSGIYYHTHTHTHTHTPLSFLISQLEPSACREASDRDPGSKGEEASTSDRF